MLLVIFVIYTILLLTKKKKTVCVLNKVQKSIKKLLILSNLIQNASLQDIS